MTYDHSTYDYSAAISDRARTVIADRLDAIEREENVAIVLAVESGSRAWGFPSADSDYDVRFIYVRPADWYLSIDLEFKRDVIERPITDDVDISGWDIRKALALLRKSNPPLLEWLGSPIVYREQESIAGRFRELLPLWYSPPASLYHYLSMAKGNYRDYLREEMVRTKKYFYVLRPLLAIMWVEQRRGPVPMEFERLMDALVTDAGLRTAIDELLMRKRSGEELNLEPRVPALNAFIETELVRMESVHVDPPGSRPDIEPLNEFFRWSVEEAWRARS